MPTPSNAAKPLSAVEEKAVTLVLEGRVTITWRTGSWLTGDLAGSGVVDGTTATYQASFSPAGRICTCPAGQNHRVCSHALALELAVTAEEDSELSNA